ncbi:MAG: CoA-binding protein, partial [Desulfobacteraceae bacterium]
MGLYNLEKIFAPKSIAVVGASEKPRTVGEALIRNLVGGGSRAEIFPVNPNYSTVMGLKAYGSLTEIRRGVDLAVIATPIATVPEIAAECVQNGVGGAIVISAGGKEAGAEGRKIEQKIARIAREGGLRIVGPN